MRSSRSICVRSLIRLSLCRTCRKSITGKSYRKCRSCSSYRTMFCAGKPSGLSGRCSRKAADPRRRHLTKLPLYPAAGGFRRTRGNRAGEFLHPDRRLHFLQAGRSAFAHHLYDYGVQQSHLRTGRQRLHGVCAFHLDQTAHGCIHTGRLPDRLGGGRRKNQQSGIPADLSGAGQLLWR